MGLPEPKRATASRRASPNSSGASAWNSSPPTVAAEPKVPVVMAFYGTPLEEPWNMVIHTALEGEERAGKIRYTWKDNLAGMDEVLSAHAGEADVILTIVKPDQTRLALRSRRYRVGESESLLAGLKSRMPSARVRWGKGGV